MSCSKCWPAWTRCNRLLRCIIFSGREVRSGLGPALHARPLLGQDKLAAGEIASWLGEQDGDLEWESTLAVKVLMQAVEVPRHVLQQQRRRPRLTSGVTSL